ncbi:MAG: hypothetical protein XD60_0856 [Acetothermia bacterium 64_32]|nr:MAG: hypothetical protein XD60_0856 [Acetothermia bacterium 64_32]MBC7097608.1 metal-sulfur cluster assembly factor [Candidatus Bipolaricaulota bacterium]HAF70701.1 aromatic ring hydroxylase [Candidatus Acetothermia bacterium]
MEVTQEAVREVLRERVIDPELGINVVDLGLIYDVAISGGRISVDMTLTTPGCPLAGTLAAQVEEVLRQAFPGLDVEVSLVWEPRWTPELMSEEARRHLSL